MSALRDLFHFKHRRLPRLTALQIWKYIGPGFLVTVGFIDPGNWASNLAAGAGFGYKLLWVVSLSTVMLIILQHNAAHLGIATGLCLSEAAAKHLPKAWARLSLYSAVGASISTALAELLGGAIALNMLFGLPLPAGGVVMAVTVGLMLFTNGYKRIERIIIALVSLIGLSFVFELSLVPIDWAQAARGAVVPALPDGSIAIVMSVLGAVVMPHNLFLHSEIIQSRQWNLENDAMIRHQLRFEFADTLVSMIAGWAINSAMILLAACVFFTAGQQVDALEQAQALLGPLLGPAAATVFACSLLLSGLSSSVTAGIAGGSIYAGIFGEPYDIGDYHSRIGVLVTLIPALAIIFMIPDAFRGLIVSQIVLSIQLPITIILQIVLTSSAKVMGKYANPAGTKALLWGIASVVIALNIWLLIDTLSG